VLVSLYFLLDADADRFSSKDVRALRCSLSVACALASTASLKTRTRRPIPTIGHLYQVELVEGRLQGIVSNDEVRAVVASGISLRCWVLGTMRQLVYCRARLRGRESGVGQSLPTEDFDSSGVERICDSVNE